MFRPQPQMVVSALRMWVSECIDQTFSRLLVPLIEHTYYIQTKNLWIISEVTHLSLFRLKLDQPQYLSDVVLHSYQGSNQLLTAWSNLCGCLYLMQHHHFIGQWNHSLWLVTLGPLDGCWRHTGVVYLWRGTNKKVYFIGRYNYEHKC